MVELFERIKFYNPPEVLRRRPFEKLREQVYSYEGRSDLWRRLETRPELTEEERRIGVLVEELEPQVRNAVVVFNRKGYRTNSSGFDHSYANWQMIEGNFLLDPPTQQALRQLGVQTTTVSDWRWLARVGAGVVDPAEGSEEDKVATKLRWQPERADLDAIRQRWDTIAALLPNRTEPEPTNQATPNL